MKTKILTAVLRVVAMLRVSACNTSCIGARSMRRLQTLAAAEPVLQEWLAPAGAAARHVPVVGVRIPAVPVRIPAAAAEQGLQGLLPVPCRCCSRPVALALAPQVRPGRAPTGPRCRRSAYSEYFE